MHHLQPITSNQKSECSICQSEIENKIDNEALEFKNCKHCFHAECIQQWFKQGKISCPNCGILYEKVQGGQPDGEMSFNFSLQQLTGYEGIPSIEISFRFPDGIQDDRHPKPGKPYFGTSRLCFLPATTDGLKVLQTISDTYRGKAVFTVGKSITTGKENCVIWDGIHFKTRRHGGAVNHAYPDPSYFDRVVTECSSKGYTMDTNLKYFEPKKNTAYLSHNKFTQPDLYFIIVDNEILCIYNGVEIPLGDNSWERVSKIMFAYQKNWFSYKDIDLNTIESSIR